MFLPPQKLSAVKVSLAILKANNSLKGIWKELYNVHNTSKFHITFGITHVEYNLRETN